jgi:glycine cleavage system H protein
VNTQPYGEGWMIRIRISDPAQIDELLSADNYRALIG